MVVAGTKRAAIRGTKQPPTIIRSPLSPCLTHKYYGHHHDLDDEYDDEYGGDEQ